ncbi:MAG: alanine--tRNA ligase [Bacteroidales bacterium]
MDSYHLRSRFLDFFVKKQHIIVPSAPIVVKNDPSLMFTNAGMNQFKDYFLGNRKPEYTRVANSQKCLRVSGKHNDLEEVGLDTYHHTMFEMLGNWSFGDYFKEEAVKWAYEFLVKELQISPERLYATVFEGSAAENLDFDMEAWEYWKKYLPDNQVLPGSRKDNFWEMGNTGPCGPCSEIHIDIRPDSERKVIAGAELVNREHPRVIEIWNLVFIQYNRKSDGRLEALPSRHVDTGMGFERLCMVVQGKQSNYDTDLFLPIIQNIAGITGIPYGKNNKDDRAMRVIADHLRTLAFSIADGQIPSNNKAGYVIRRILRRSIRYGFSFLGQSQPFIYRLVPTLVKIMGDAYPELNSQQKLIEKVIAEEESAFLRTLDTGMNRLDHIISRTDSKVIDGKSAFELYDTYGFPPDLTGLILKEKGYTLNQEEFKREMEAQKTRSRQDAMVDAGDWTVIREHRGEEFMGYDHLEAQVEITRYRKIKSKGRELYHLVFNKTPFYAESGGQIGDTGTLQTKSENIKIINTLKENELNIHVAEKLPDNPGDSFRAVVDREKRKLTANNHTATHLLHNALRDILGNHVEQKGSLVHYDYLRFDFSHFQKISDIEIKKLEDAVNRKIRENIPREEHRKIPLQKARDSGAISLFGEKYGNKVRTIRFGNSLELCGGTHVEQTGQIGLFRIVSESAVAAGIRRIEAVTGSKAEEWVNEQVDKLNRIKALLRSTADPEKTIRQLLKDKSLLEKQIEQFTRDRAKELKSDLLSKAEKAGEITIIAGSIAADSPGTLKDIAFQLKGEIKGLFMVLGAEISGKAHLAVMLSEELVSKKKLKANEIIRSIANNIQGGGGGQDFFATAGGKNPAGIKDAINKAVNIARESA